MYIFGIILTNFEDFFGGGGGGGGARRGWGGEGPGLPPPPPVSVCNPMCMHVHDIVLTKLKIVQIKLNPIIHVYVHEACDPYNYILLS